MGAVGRVGRAGGGGHHNQALLADANVCSSDNGGGADGWDGGALML